MTQNKKWALFIVLSVLAVVSLTWGILTPAKGRQRVSRDSEEDPGRPASERTPEGERARQARREGFVGWGRNPFSPREEEKTSDAVELVLAGIAWDAVGPRAVINDQILTVGDTIEGNTVVAIKQDRVVLNDGVRDYELR